MSFSRLAGHTGNQHVDDLRDSLFGDTDFDDLAADIGDHILGSPGFSFVDDAARRSYDRRGGFSWMPQA